jgi:hypothetical protein
VGRKPLFDKAMTPAERQRRRRARKETAVISAAPNTQLTLRVRAAGDAFEISLVPAGASAPPPVVERLAPMAVHGLLVGNDNVKIDLAALPAAEMTSLALRLLTAARARLPAGASVTPVPNLLLQ